MKQASLLAAILYLSTAIFAQETVTVISIKANLRGTPSTSGIVVSTVNKGESFELIKEKSPWYLVQTPNYVGWLHGNAIQKDDDLPDLSAYAVRNDPVPTSTTKPVTGGESPFKSEYVGIDNTIIRVINSANRTLNLNFGGVKYVIAKDQERTIEVDGGNYEYFASAPGVIPASGVKNFAKGYKYSWDFFITTRYR